MALSEKEIDAILEGIWKGNITVNSLPKKVYNENKEKLNKGVEKGFGSKLKDHGIKSKAYKTLSSLQDNVTFFSAAKTFQQVNDMQFLRFDEKGFIRSFNDFKKDAGQVFETYNTDWLETEFNTSISQSQSAEQWATIIDQKNDLPLLQYQTADDGRVRDEHSAWDNIVRKVDDPFWSTVMPPNGFNCRCTVIQLSSGKVSSLSGVAKNTNGMFADNVGETEQVFKEKGKDKHPYFNAPQKRKDKNFGL
jgi:SPP1 gp7 family putative phage head morphogenesis protein